MNGDEVVDTQADNLSDTANHSNTKEIYVGSSYKISDIDISDLPDRVYEACKNFEIFELEYLVPDMTYKSREDTALFKK